MEQATNTFTKGLQTDIHPMMQTNEVLSDCLNGTVITMNGNEPALQNDMGNVRVEDANLPSGYTPVGMKEYGGVIYVAAFNPVTGKSQIGSFPSPERKKSLDDDLKATFDFDKFQADSYYEDLNKNGTYDNNESYFLKNDSYLVPLTGSVALHVGDKFVIYSSSELSAISDEITNWNNVYEEYQEVTENNETIQILTKGIAYSPKNRKYTIQVGILNEQNEFVDITKSLVRWDGNDRISDFINDSDIYKFNKGYHIAIEDEDEWQDKIIPDDDRQFILNRQANPINNFSYKLAGPLYLKISYNHVQSFNYDIEGQVNGSNLELTIKGYFTYNCPDVANAPTQKTVFYQYIYKGYEEEKQFQDDYENPAYWSADQSDIYTGPTGYEWENTKPNKDFIYISIRKKIDGIWGQFSEPVLFDDFVQSTSSEDYYTYELAEATDIDDKLINYDFNITKFINAGTEQQNIPTDPNPSSIYSDIAYDKQSNLYSCTLTKKYVYNLSELSNIIDSKLDYEIKTYSGLTKENNYTIYLKNLCYNGIIDVSLLNSGELTLKQYKFYNKLATEDNEKNQSLLLLRFESYPKEGESRRNLKIEFRNINTSEDQTPKRLITDQKITNGVIQLPFTWEQVKKYNSSTEEWDINSQLDSRKVYDIKIYYDLYDKDDNLIESNVLYDDIATKAYIDDTDFDNLTPAEQVTYKPCFKYDTDSISYEMTVTDYTSNPPQQKTITQVGDTWEDENQNTHIVTEILYWRTERWFLTTELFNDLYSDQSGIDDYCTTEDERITNIELLPVVDQSNILYSYGDVQGFSYFSQNSINNTFTLQQIVKVNIDVYSILDLNLYPDDINSDITINTQEQSYTLTEPLTGTGEAVKNLYPFREYQIDNILTTFEGHLRHLTGSTEDWGCGLHTSKFVFKDDNNDEWSFKNDKNLVLFSNTYTTPPFENKEHPLNLTDKFLEYYNKFYKFELAGLKVVPIPTGEDTTVTNAKTWYVYFGKDAKLYISELQINSINASSIQDKTINILYNIITSLNLRKESKIFEYTYTNSPINKKYGNLYIYMNGHQNVAVDIEIELTNRDIVEQYSLYKNTTNIKGYDNNGIYRGVNTSDSNFINITNSGYINVIPATYTTGLGKLGDFSGDDTVAYFYINSQ